jgi:hypothetical protein
MPLPFTLDGLREGGNWALVTRYGRLDLMQWVPGIDDYETLVRGSVIDELPELGGTIRIAGRTTS